MKVFYPKSHIVIIEAAAGLVTTLTFFDNPAARGYVWRARGADLPKNWIAV